MPKIPTLNEAQILNVGSPVPIGSAESARGAGENIQNFGMNLERAGSNLAEFAKITKTSSDAANLDAARAQIESIAQKAHFNSLGKTDDDGKALQGEDLIKNFSSDVDEQTQKLIETTSDPVMKQRLQTMVLDTKNSKTRDLYVAATQRSVQAIDDTNRQAVATSLGTLYSSAPLGADNTIYQAQNAIKGLDESLDSQVTYDRIGKEKFRVQSRQELAQAAIDAQMSIHDYNGARKVRDVLKQYVDPKDFSEISNRIGTREQNHIATTLAASEKAEREADKADREQDTTNAAKIFSEVMQTKDPILAQKIIDGAAHLVGTGGLRMESFTKISAAQRGKLAAEGGIPALDDHHANQVTSGADPTAMYKNLTDARLNGQVTPGVSAKLDKFLIQRMSAQRTDPDLYQKYVQSDSLVNRDLEKFPRNGTNFGGGYADVKANIILKKDEFIRQGKSPEYAETMALKTFIPRPTHQPIIQGFPPSQQGDTKGLEVIHQSLQALIPNAASLSVEKQRQLEQQLRAYNARSYSAQIHERKVE